MPRPWRSMKALMKCGYMGTLQGHIAVADPKDHAGGIEALALDLLYGSCRR